MKILKYRTSAAEYILRHGITIEIDIISDIDGNKFIAASNTDVGPIVDPDTYEFNQAAYDEYWEFLKHVADKLDEYDFEYDYGDGECEYLDGYYLGEDGGYPRKSPYSYSMYFDYVTKKYAQNKVKFPIRVKITDHTFDDDKRTRQQKKVSEELLMKKYDVDREHTRFLIQNVSINGEGLAYTSYDEIKADFDQKLYDVEMYIRDKEIAIAKTYMHDKFKDYNVYALAQDCGDSLRDVHIFDSLDEFLWYVIRRNIFESKHELLRFDRYNIYDYEREAFNHTMLYKGTQDKWIAYILTW